MQCLLKDAAKRQHEKEIVRHWLSKIRNLAYEAEDIIETYSVQVSSRKTEKGVVKLLKRFSGALKECVALHDIGSQISENKCEMETVLKSMQEYGLLKEIIPGESSVSTFNENKRWQRQSYPFDMTDDCFVGMEEDVKNLVSLVVDAEHQVVRIVGMGGLGKTTIARKVYNHEEIKGSFESFVWICVSKQCNIRSIFEDILRELGGGDADVKNISQNALIQRLREIQQSKRCLVVLDDVWKTDDWEHLKVAFLIRGVKNKILLTTREKSIAAFGYAYELAFLKEDDALELLKKKALPEKDATATESRAEEVIQRIGKEMVRKCGYLPLGVSLLGGVLRRKSLDKWESVNENMKAYLYNSNEAINSVLDLSYDDLPSYLKPCFLYMGLYKEDELIDAKKLCRLWVAEGLISHDYQGAHNSLLDVAEHYLSELVSRCIVQVERVDDVTEEPSYIKLHDVVRELCLLKGKTEDFRLNLLYYGDEKLGTSSSVTRRLAVHFLGYQEINVKDDFGCSLQDNRIRSIQFLRSSWYPVTFPWKVLQIWKLKLLKVLVFEHCVFEGGKLPKQIGNLVRLKELTLRSCRLDKLPSSIRNLQQLITLDLTESDDVRVPNVFKNMHHLKHLFLPRYKDKNYRLPLEGLNELEILCGFNSKIHNAKPLTKMKNLRRFEAEVNDNKTLSDILECIDSNWNNLRNCKLDIRGDCGFETSRNGDIALLKKLMECPRLHDLSVRVPVRKLQRAFDPCTTRLVSLLLIGCEIEDIDPMKILQKLPCLKSLYLGPKSYVGEAMICEATGFPRLERLAIVELPNLREWKVEEGAMPTLRYVRIECCEHLEMIPDGLKFIVTLKLLRINGMPELGKRVSKKLEDGREGDYHYKIVDF